MNLIFEIEILTNDELKTILKEIESLNFINKNDVKDITLKRLLNLSIQKEFKEKIYDIKKITEKEVIKRFLI